MITFLLLLVQPQEARAPLPARLEASRTGRFVALLGAKDVQVLDGRSLAPLARIQAAATAVGFDAKDETLWIVGAEIARFDTAEWKERARGALPDATFLKRKPNPGDAEDPGLQPGQAMATPEGQIYYRSRHGRMSRAKEEAGTWTAELLTTSEREDRLPIYGPLALSGQSVLLDFGGMAGVGVRGGAYALVGALEPLGMAALGETVAFVGRQAEGGYHPASFKVAWTRPAVNLAAAFDLKRARVHAAGPEGIRSWAAAAPATIQDGPRGRFLRLSIDGASERLYAHDGESVRAWPLAD